MNPAWKAPFTSILAGPTGAGKSFFTFKFISHISEMVTPQIEKIIYCYGEYQPIFAQYPQVVFHEGLPDMSQFDGKQHSLLVLDDFMAETNDDVSNIFTKISHHRNVSVIYLTQNLFFKSKHNRTMSLNAHYIVAFKNPRDVTQITILARQMRPQKPKFITEAFEDATHNPFSYLLIDLKPETEEKYRIRAQIFPDQWQVVYVPK